MTHKEAIEILKGTGYPWAIETAEMIERMEDVIRKKDGLIADVRSEMTQIHGWTDADWCRSTLTEALALSDQLGVKE